MQKIDRIQGGVWATFGSDGTNVASSVRRAQLVFLFGGQLSALTTVVTSSSMMKSRVLFGKARWCLLCGPIADLPGSKQVRTLERLELSGSCNKFFMTLYPPEYSDHL